MQDEVLAALTRRPDGGWDLEPKAALQLSQRLDVLARRSLQPSEDLRPVLKLIVVLESDGRSAFAARSLVRAIRRAPRAFQALVEARAQSASRTRDDLARFFAFEGRTEPPCAPLHHSPPPKGAFRARNLMRPLDRAAVRARRR